MIQPHLRAPQPSLLLSLLAVVVFVGSSYWWDDLGLWTLVPVTAAFGLVYAANRLHWAGH